MNIYPCYRHTPSRVRPSGVRLDPPLAKRWSIRDLAHDPVIAGSHVVAALRRGYLAAYAREDGQEQWRTKLADVFAPGEPREGSVLLHDGLVLIRVGGTLFRFDPASGEERQQQPMPAFDLWGGVIVDGLLFGEFDEGGARYCGAYDLASGTVAWREPWKGLTSAAAGDRGVGVLLKDKATLAAFDVKGGARVWERSFADLGRFEDISGPPKAGWPAGVFAVWNDLLIVPVAGHHVVALDLASGSIRWQTRIDCRVPSSLVVDPSGSVFVFDVRALYQLDAATGAIVAQADPRPSLVKEHGLSVFTAVESTGGCLYACDMDGTLFALQPSDARVLWTHELGRSVTTRQAPVVLDGQLYQVTSSGMLSVFGRS